MSEWADGNSLATSAVEGPTRAERTQVSNADALLLMADTFLASGPAERTGGDRQQVVFHVDASALTADRDVVDVPGACQLEDGSALHPETARRLACDASIVRILEQDGRPLSVGRKTRSVPLALRRALRSRDRACRFPGCGQRRFLHAHHLDHWAHGGSTDLSNLIHLCARHHRLVHEGGYRIEGHASGALRFRCPEGKVVPHVPSRPRGDAHEPARRNRRDGLVIDSETCVQERAGERMTLHWVVNGLVDHDPRLRE